MGRQLGFYFGDNDEKQFLEFVRANDVVFLRHCVKEAKNEVYNEFNINPAINQSIAQSYICFQAELECIRYIGSKEIGFFLIDIHDSPVIEYDRSGLKSDSNLLISGRLWYQHKYWTKDESGHDIIREKSKELEKLYNSLTRWIKKYCTRLPNGNYIGPHAMELYKNGAKLP